MSEASNNGTKCASARTINLMETAMCNELECSTEIVRRKPVGNPDDFFDKTISSKSELL